MVNKIDVRKLHREMINKIDSKEIMTESLQTLQRERERQRKAEAENGEKYENLVWILIFLIVLGGILALGNWMLGIIGAGIGIVIIFYILTSKGLLSIELLKQKFGLLSQKFNLLFKK